MMDVINAMPLSRDETGGRRGNVEADLLLVETAGNYALVVCEVKDGAVENLWQLKLIHLNAYARRLFYLRAPQLSLPDNIPIIGLVVAPEQYCNQPTGPI